MSARNASRLDAGLIARKGEAAPASGRSQPTPVGSEESTVEERAGGMKANRIPHGVQGTIAVTVRLDPRRYERMKVHGARRRLTNQDILVDALDRYFAVLTE